MIALLEKYISHHELQKKKKEITISWNIYFHPVARNWCMTLAFWSVNTLIEIEIYVYSWDGNLEKIIIYFSEERTKWFISSREWRLLQFFGKSEKMYNKMKKYVCNIFLFNILNHIALPPIVIYRDVTKYSEKQGIFARDVCHGKSGVPTRLADKIFLVWVSKELITTELK